ALLLHLDRLPAVRVLLLRMVLGGGAADAARWPVVRTSSGAARRRTYRGLHLRKPRRACDRDDLRLDRGSRLLRGTRGVHRPVPPPGIGAGRLALLLRDRPAAPRPLSRRGRALRPCGPRRRSPRCALAGGARRPRSSA